ncbi:MAG: hypothetical protein ABSG25_01560 [Bryobacteraceae bacterium]
MKKLLNEIIKFIKEKTDIVIKYYLELENIVRNLLSKNDRIVTISLIVLVLFGFIIIPIYRNVSFSIERKNWYTSSYYINSKIQDNLFITKEDREKEVILKIVGYLKMNKCNWTDDEMYNYSKTIFDTCDDNGWDYFMPVIIAQKKTNFNKKYNDKFGNRGLYKLSPVVTDLVSAKVETDYYNGMEYDIVNSTKIWLEYIKILMTKFSDINLALIAYDVGCDKFINESGLNLDDKLEMYSVNQSDIERIRKHFYGNNSFDMQVNKDAKKIRFFGFDELDGSMDLKK